jgi:phosphoesterase RecJ-like protein
MKNNKALIVKKIKSAQKILISGHVNPDGDCIGSMLALGLGLKSIGKDICMYVEGSIPHVYSYLPGIKNVSHSVAFRPDLAISVDCNTKEMVGRAYRAFKKAACVVEIDHHEYRRSFGDIEWVSKYVSCVGEMIYELLSNLKISITQDIATCILTSLIIESGSFRFPSVTSHTFLLCSKLMKHGVDYTNVVNNLFMSRHKQSALLSGICLSRSSFSLSGKVVWSIIRKDDFSAVKGKDEDVDPVPDEMRSIKGVLVAILFREKKANILRVSLRSKQNINVALLAEKYNGGGHFDVAGCVIENSERAIRAFVRDAELIVKRSTNHS